MAVGRPTLYSEELAEKFCSRIASGRAIRDVCTDSDMPSRTTIALWCKNDKEFSNRYNEAKKERGEKIFEEVLNIVDNVEPDVPTEKYTEDMVPEKGIFDVKVAVDAEAIAVVSSLKAYPISNGKVEPVCLNNEPMFVEPEYKVLALKLGIETSPVNVAPDKFAFESKLPCKFVIADIG